MPPAQCAIRLFSIFYKDIPVAFKFGFPSAHYGWVIVAAGAMVLFSCLGLGRFAYAVLLPAMQNDLGLPYEQMGLIGTSNFVGYLAAVYFAPIFVDRFRPRATIGAALVLIAVAMVSMSATRNLHVLTFFYTLVGLGSGFANISMMALLPWWFESAHRGKAAGLMITGNGLAIMFAGFLIPLLTRSYGIDGWQKGWLFLGLICLILAGIVAALLRNHPQELGLEALGQPGKASRKPAGSPTTADGWILVRLGLLYFIFGITFMVYGTFFVTTLVDEYAFSEQKAGLYWSWVGFFSLFSGVGFGMLSDRIGRKQGLAVVFAVQMTAYALVGFKFGGPALFLSLALYGLAVFAIPAIMAAAMGDYLGPVKAPKAFAAVTLFFALGQTISPVGAGFIAGATGSFSMAYLAAALLTAGGALLAVILPSPPKG